jgi:alpha-ribazole phosphatase/probable phosphoglycerate mutase
MAIQLVFETHSLTTDNAAGIATGWLPGELSPEGRRLAAELGARRRDDGIAAVYVSDLARALQTASIAFEGSGIPIVTDPRLRECNYGDWNGMPTSKLAAERAKRIHAPYPGGQSYMDVVSETAAFLRDLLRDRDGQRLLLISHSANKWALDHLLAGARLEDLVDADFGWREGWEYEVRTAR